MSAESDKRLTVLTAFEKALRREAHNLRWHPGILWQQMYNRLQWEGEPVSNIVETTSNRRAVSTPSTIWMRKRTSFVESTALVRLFFILDARCASISPDGKKWRWADTKVY